MGYKKKLDNNDIVAIILRDGHIKCKDGFFTLDNELVPREKIEDYVTQVFQIYMTAERTKIVDGVERNCSEIELMDNMTIRDKFIENLNPQEETIPPYFLFQFIETHKNSKALDMCKALAQLIFNKRDYMLLIEGAAGAGKSMLMDMLKELFKGFCKPLTVHQLSSEHVLTELEGTFMILGDDLGKEGFAKNIGLIKSVTSGQTISVNPKFLKPKMIVPHCNFIFNFNNFPLIDYTDLGVLRRLVYFNLDRRFILDDDFFTYQKKYIKNPKEIKRLLDFLYYLYKNTTYDELRLIRLNSQKEVLKNCNVLKLKGDSYFDYVENCRVENMKAYSKENYENIIKYNKSLDIYIKSINEKWTPEKLKHELYLSDNFEEIEVGEGGLPF